MAEPQPKAAAAAAPSEEDKKRPTGGRMVMVGFVSLIMLVETALFFFLVPSAEEVAALAELRFVEKIKKGEQAAAVKENDENAIHEFDLGMFGETFSPIDTENRYRVEFRLFGLVKKRHLKIIESELESKAGRLRHAIRMKVRNSEISELEENQLGLLQRRILATCNHLLEDDILLSIGFADYQIFQE